MDVFKVLLVAIAICSMVSVSVALVWLAVVVTSAWPTIGACPKKAVLAATATQPVLILCNATQKPENATAETELWECNVTSAKKTFFTTGKSFSVKNVPIATTLYKLT